MPNVNFSLINGVSSRDIFFSLFGYFFNIEGTFAGLCGFIKMKRRIAKVCKWIVINGVCVIELLKCLIKFRIDY